MRTFIRHIRFSALLLPALAALALSCGKLQSPEGNGGSRDGDATVQIAISSAPLTKAEDGSTKYAKDGDKMNNLRVWMVDGSNKVSAYASSDTAGAVVFNDASTTATVTFDNVTRGNYTLYLLANDNTSLTSYGKGSTIDDNFKKAALSLPSGSTYPSYSDSEGMPLSLKKSISVGPGKNSISAELVRVCGQINVTIKNRTKDKAIYITGVSLSQRSPSSGYVFQQDDHSSPTGTTQGNLASNATLTRIDPVDPTVEGSGEAKMISCYLFENCSGTDALQLSVTGGLFASSVTSVEYTTATGYKATDESTTDTDINSSNYYFIASASAPRQFLNVSNSSLTVTSIGTDAELNVKDDIMNYLWQFTDITDNTTTLYNVGSKKYLKISRNSYSIEDNSSSVLTGTGTGRYFAYESRQNTYYLYNDSGTLAVSSSADATQRGWYLRKATEYTYTTGNLSPTPEKEINKTSPLTYTDSYGEIQPLTKVCRNDKVEIIVNLFYNPLTSSFDFQVEEWRKKDNQTTFD